MNVFDFDKTIFPYDSSTLFIEYCFSRYARLFLRSSPKILAEAAKYRFAGSGADATAMKEQLFSFLSGLEDPDAVVHAFWQRNLKKINTWYLELKSSDDVVISASPEFLLEPVQKQFGFQLLATRMDINSGKIFGMNCHDVQKVKRFYEAYPNGRIDNFYSDSLSDSPLAELAEKAYLVKGSKLTPWPEKKRK